MAPAAPNKSIFLSFNLSKNQYLRIFHTLNSLTFVSENHSFLKQQTKEILEIPPVLVFITVSLLSLASEHVRNRDSSITAKLQRRGLFVPRHQGVLESEDDLGFIILLMHQG